MTGKRSEFQCELLSRGPRQAVLGYRMPRTMQLEDVTLPRDTLSLGYFWEDRAYNVYHWVDDAGQTLALYFNICDNTYISADQIAWRDLTLDILMTSDLRYRVLDEDELPQDLDQSLRGYIETARDHICVDPRARLSEIENFSRQLLSR